jgi:2-hydroxychromene-2-carboxylate isomerase
VVWPEGWPVNSLAAMRAAVWADRQGLGPAFARAVYEREFAHGEDISGVAALDAIGRSAGVEGIPEAVADPEIKQALREATEAAWERGVQGVPTLEAGRRLYFGDDRLEEAAEARRG